MKVIRTVVSIASILILFLDCVISSKTSLISRFNLTCSENFSSCSGRCSNTYQYTSSSNMSCFCDPHCSMINDCCKDFQEYCPLEAELARHGTATSKHWDNNELSSRSLFNGSLDAHLTLPESWKMAKLTQSTIASGGCKRVNRDSPEIWIVDSCPNRTNLELSYNCTFIPDIITKSNMSHNLPVIGHDNITYRNKYCARCHGVVAYRTWNLGFECPVGVHRMPIGDMTFVWKYCIPHVFLNRTLPHRHCNKPISDCPTSWTTNSTTVETSLLDECRNGQTGIVSNGSKKKVNTFKNIACAICNSEHIHHTFYCWPKESRKITKNIRHSLSVLLHFNKKDTEITDSTMVVNCLQKDTYVYDPYLQVCRQRVSTMPVAEQADTFEVYVWLKISDNNSFTETVIRKFITEQKDGRDLQINIESIKSLFHYIQVVLSVEISRAHFYKNTTIDPFVENLINWSSASSVPFSDKNLTVIKIVSRLARCAEPEMFNSTQYGLIDNTTRAIEVFPLSMTFTSRQYYVEDYKKSSDVTICHPIFLNSCNGTSTKLQDKEYVLYNNRSILWKRRQSILGYREYNLINGSIWVCVNLMHKYGHINRKRFPLPREDEALVVFTKIGLSGSILSLGVVEFTYFEFPSLRTVPGKNIISLSFSILAYQILFLVGINQIKLPVLCTTIAISLHFFILASFCSMSVIAWDTCRTFTATVSLRRAQSSRLQLIKYQFAVWLPSLVLVVCCVLLNTLNICHIGYGESNVCWISESRSLIYFFAIPVGLLMVFQLVCFSFAAASIWKTEKISHAVLDTQHCKNTSSFKKTLKVSLKLSTLMGFTWVFGYLANIFPVLNYAFVILCSSQGIFIGIAFIINSRVKRLYMERMKIRKTEAPSHPVSPRDGLTLQTSYV